MDIVLSLLESPLSALVLCLLLGAVAMSGKLSQLAANLCLVGVCIVGGIGILRGAARQPRLASGAILVLIGFCLVISHWIRPEKENKLPEQPPRRGTEAKPQTDFKVEWALPIVSDTTVTEGKIRRKWTTFFLQVAVLNKGTPSVIGNIELIVKFRDGRQFKGILFVPDQEILTFPTPDGGSTSFHRTSAFITRATTVPIATNARVSGFVMYKFPAEIRPQMTQVGTVYIFTVWDAEGKEYKTYIPWVNELATEIGRMPGVD